jgi:hypothetical protein
VWGNDEQFNSIAGSGKVAIEQQSIDLNEMENYDRLVQFIDRHTNYGTEELPQIFGEGVGAEDFGMVYLNQFTDRDWRQLQSYWQAQSDYWIEALMFLLVNVDSTNARDLLVTIALSGSYESRLTALDYVRDFSHTLSPEIVAQLKNNPVIYKRRMRH